MSATPAQQTESAAMISRLLSATDDEGQQDLIRQNPQIDWGQIVSDLADRVRQEVHVNTAEAHRLANIAITVAEAANNPVALAKGRRAKANALYATDEHAAAIEMHHSAAALFEAAGEKQELARTLSGSIQPMLLLGHYDQALVAAEK